MQQFFSVADAAGPTAALIAEVLACRQNPKKDQLLGLGKTLGLLFLNPSLRTRASTELAARNLGMDVHVLNGGADTWAMEFAQGAIMNNTRVEHIKDAAGVLGRYYDILGLRSFASLQNREADYGEPVLDALKRYSGKQLVSLESATRHPLQSLADMATIQSHATKPALKVVLAWAPHIKPLPQAVANSFAEWSLAAGHSLTIAHPPGMELAPQFTQGATLNHNLEEALQGADFVYVKNWSAYEPYGHVPTNYQNWMLTEQHLASAPAARIMHCLPVRRNVELSDELLDGPRSLVLEQAENRIYAAQAVLRRMLLHIV